METEYTKWVNHVCEEANMLPLDLVEEEYYLWYNIGTHMGFEAEQFGIWAESLVDTFGIHKPYIRFNHGSGELYLYFWSKQDKFLFDFVFDRERIVRQMFGIDRMKV